MCSVSLIALLNPSCSITHLQLGQVKRDWRSKAPSVWLILVLHFGHMMVMGLLRGSRYLLVERTVLVTRVWVRWWTMSGLFFSLWSPPLVGMFSVVADGLTIAPKSVHRVDVPQRKANPPAELSAPRTPPTCSSTLSVAASSGTHRFRANDSIQHSNPNTARSLRHTC